MRYSVRECSSSEARGVSPWRGPGPWAARYFAGALYACNFGYLPSASDWAAQTFVIRAPPLRAGYLGTVHADDPAVSRPSTHEEIEIDPKPKANLSTRVPAPSDDLLNCRRHPSTQRSSSRSIFTPIPANDPNFPPRSYYGVSRPRGGFIGAGPLTMSHDSPAPPLNRESASQHRGRPMRPGHLRPLPREIHPPRPCLSRPWLLSRLSRPAWLSRPVL